MLWCYEYGGTSWLRSLTAKVLSKSSFLRYVCNQQQVNNSNTSCVKSVKPNPIPLIHFGSHGSWSQSLLNWGESLDRSQINPGLTPRWTIIHTHIHSYGQFRVCHWTMGGNQRTQACMGRTCKLCTERHIWSTRDLLARANSASNCTIVPPNVKSTSC